MYFRTVCKAIMILLLICSGQCTGMGSDFRLLNEGCVCPRQEVVYECIINGTEAVATVWSGTAFSCPGTGNQISLRHYEFENGSAVGVCNNGAIAAHGIRRANNIFISQLNITIYTSMDGTTVQCAADDGRTNSIVGNHAIQFSDHLSPPSDLHLSKASSDILTFDWNQTVSNCPSLRYIISANSCGSCPHSTHHTTITCTGINAKGNVCSFGVSLSPCGSDSGHRAASTITILLKVSDPPVVSCTPHYFEKNKSLNSIHVTLHRLDSFNISESIDGSPISYTISYSDSVSGASCGLTSIPASSCEDGTCSDVFEVTTSSCPPFTDITVTVFATNVLGNGPTSTPTKIESMNSFIEVVIDLSTSIVSCNFFNQQNVSIKSCTIDYGPSGSCDSLPYSSQNNYSTHSMIDIDLLTHLGFHDERMYCYMVTASNGTHSVAVHGIFSTACSPTDLSDGTPVPDDISCDAPLRTLGFKTGIICYSNTDIGATAIYSCMGCGVNKLKRTPVRTCLSDGIWNGTIPQCNCGGEMVLALSVSTSTLLCVIVAIASVMVTVIALLIRTNRKVQKELTQAKANAVYDEIANNTPPGSPGVDTKKNVAYEKVHVVKVVTVCQ